MDENQEPSKLAKRVDDAQKAIKLAKRLKVLWPIISAAAPYILLVFVVFSFVCFATYMVTAAGNVTPIPAPIDAVTSALCSSDIMVIDSAEGENGSYPLEEYIVGVVTAENAYIDDANPTNIESMKAQAIAARTYAVVTTHNCTTAIQDGQSHQAYGFGDGKIHETPYSFATASELVKKAVKDTEGMVLTSNGTIFLSEYDSLFCTTTDGICTSYDVNGNCKCTYTKQPGLETYTLSIYPAEISEWLGGHGRGMSQVYANYLQRQGYTYDQILKFFYSPTVQIVQYSSNSVGICNAGVSYYGMADAGVFVEPNSTVNAITKLLACTAPQVQKAFAVINTYCSNALFSATRDINYIPKGSNAATCSNHYVGRAIDLQGGGTATQTYDTNTGFLYYVTIENNSKDFPNTSFYRLYCKVVKNIETTSPFVKSNFTIQPVYYKGNSGGGPYVYDDFHYSTTVTDNLLDVTAVLNSFGLYGTRPMNSCIDDSSTNDNSCLEWWHYNDSSGVGVKTFKQLYFQAYGQYPSKCN